MKVNVQILLATIVLCILIVLSMLSGSELISLTDLWSGITTDNKYSFIIWELRLPKMVTAVFGGFALAVSGLLMQSYFRNALAGPYILGVSAGSGLGVAILFLSGSIIGWELSDIQNGSIFFSVLGAGLTLLLVMLISRKVGNGPMLLIVGLMIGSFASALVSVMQFFAPSQAIKKYVLWTMGSLASVDNSELLVFVGLLLPFMFLAFYYSNAFNAFLLGPSQARSLGISERKIKMVTMLISGVLAGVVTAFCGPIAFIGLTAPHLAKLMSKTSHHQLLVPYAGLIGAILLLSCDIVAQMPGFDFTLPINAVTSIIGAPIVLIVILNQKVFNYEG